MADATPGSVPSSNRNVMIVLSYLWLLALVPLLTEKDDKEVQWHAKHGLVLMVAELFLWIAISVVLGAIHAYQATLSPLYERLGVRCRFTPTCSHYGEAVVGRYGVIRGGWLAAKR